MFIICYDNGLAEREGFEPPIGLHLCRISSAVHSTTLPPLQGPPGRAGPRLALFQAKWKQVRAKNARIDTLPRDQMQNRTGSDVRHGSRGQTEAIGASLWPSGG